MSVGFQKVLLSLATGMTAAGVKSSKLKELSVPLPPLAEQRRIVARIDQLMARCDELEAFRAAQQQKRLDVHTSALNALLTAQEPQAFAEAWGFVAEQFGDLYSVPGNVAELRKAVLQLAVMGKLVPQDPADQPASELLKEIQAEKRRLVIAGKIRAPKPLPPVTPEQQPYEVPQGWAWVQMDSLVSIGTGSTPSTGDPSYYGGTIPWYTSSSTSKSIADVPTTYITEKALTETNCKIFPEGSLIIALYGQGKTRGQISELALAGATNQAIAAMVFYETSKPLKQYIKYFFIKIYDEIRLLSEGAAQPNLNVGKIKETLLPLPPLAEQRRIVAKIDQVMALCDTLEAQLAAQTGKQSELLHSLMAAVTPRSTTPERRAQPAGAKAVKEPRAPKEVSAGNQDEPKRPGRPPKAASIPSASGEAEAIQQLELLKLERAQGTRQVSLFE